MPLRALELCDLNPIDTSWSAFNYWVCMLGRYLTIALGSSELPADGVAHEGRVAFV